MKTSLLFLLFVSSASFAQTLTLPALKQLKTVTINDNIQVPNAQIVYPVVGLTAMKIKEEYNPMTGSTQYLEVELWVVDARGKVVYYYTTTTKGLANQPIDEDYIRYMNTQGHEMKHRL